MGSSFSWAGLKKRAEPPSAVRPPASTTFRTSVNNVQQSMTRFKYEEGVAVYWDADANEGRKDQKRWICEIDEKEEVVQDSDDMEEGIIEAGSDDEGLEPKVPKAPNMPSEREREIHEVTHIPYREWCEACVEGKAIDSPHKKSKEEHDVPTVGMDYMFMGSKGETSLIPILVVKDSASKSLITIPTKCKGVKDEWAVKRTCEDIDKLGHNSIILKSDQEPAIREFQEAIQNYRSRNGMKTHVENSAVNDHRQNGLAENGVRNAQAQIRTMKCGLDRKLNKQVPAKTAILYWLILHAGTVICRYQIGKDGKTPYQRIRGKRCRGPALQFGEICFYRPTSTSDKHMNKMEKRWREGVFIGVESKSSELIMAHCDGAETARCIKRKPENKRWGFDVVMAITATPWDPQRRKTREERPVVRGDHGEAKMVMEEEEKIFPEPVPSDDVKIKRKAMKVQKKDIEEHGYTVGCPGCTAMMNNSYQIAHDTKCRQRIQEELNKSEEGQARVERDDQRTGEALARELEKEDEEKESKKRRKVTSDERKETSATATSSSDPHGSAEKRPAEKSGDNSESRPKKKGRLDNVARRAMLMMEYFDDVTHRRLPNKLVLQARNKEMTYVRKHRLYDKVHMSQAERHEVVDVKWLDINKGDECNYDVRSRLVGRQFRNKGQLTVFAATPPLESLKYLLSRASRGQRKGMKLGFIDVSRAYFYAPARKKIFVRIPPEDFESGDESNVGLLNYSMYGTQDAAFNWGEFCKDTLVPIGFV